MDEHIDLLALLGVNILLTPETHLESRHSEGLKGVVATSAVGLAMFLIVGALEGRK